MLAPLPRNREDCPSCTDGALDDGTWCSRCEGMGAIVVCEDCGVEMRGAKRCPSSCGWCGDHSCKVDAHNDVVRS